MVELADNEWFDDVPEEFMLLFIEVCKVKLVVGTPDAVELVRVELASVEMRKDVLLDKLPFNVALSRVEFERVELARTDPCRVVPFENVSVEVTLVLELLGEALFDVELLGVVLASIELIVPG